MNPKVEFKNFHDLFVGSHTLRIPDYQRGFKWPIKQGSESSVEYFVQSLLDNQHAPEFFLQGITVYEDASTIELVDGQQRITTMYLLLLYLGDGSISELQFKYESREDTQKFLTDLKGKTRENMLAMSAPDDKDSQDVHFVKEAIRQIDGKLGKRDDRDTLLEFIKERIKIIYVPILKENIVRTFMMMNGAKAVMRQEELVKAEMLRRVSEPLQTTPVCFGTLENAFDEMKRFMAMDLMTASLRSRYAREWDRWLQWWYQPAVMTFFKLPGKRPLGRLLSDFVRDNDWEKDRAKEAVDFRTFKQFQPESVFEKLRKQQKQYEDLYNTPVLYNYLGMALYCSKQGEDRYETLRYFRKELHDVDALHRYTALRVYGCTHKEAEAGNVEKRRQAFNQAILQQEVYNNANAEAVRLLMWLNLLQDNRLGRKFNFDIDGQTSLEHIFPKSKVYHAEMGIDGERKYRKGDNAEVSREDYQLRGADILLRETLSEYAANKGCPRLTEHSIGNLVLLYVKDNSTFSNKPYAEKKEIFFKMDIKDSRERRRVFESRKLIHSMAKFSCAAWGLQEMVGYYQEIKTLLDHGLENKEQQPGERV